MEIVPAKKQTKMSWKLGGGWRRLDQGVYDDFFFLAKNKNKKAGFTIILYSIMIKNCKSSLVTCLINYHIYRSIYIVSGVKRSIERPSSSIWTKTIAKSTTTTLHIFTALEPSSRPFSF